MGGDKGPSVTVPACLKALGENPALHLILVGDEHAIARTLNANNPNWDKRRVRIHHTTQVVEMDELPTTALRRKRDSSMRVAIDLVRDGEAQACVSAGNTGALMVIARMVLKMIPGIDRPPILFPLPSQKGEVYMLDLGANVECTAEHLFQFAIMGSVLVSATSKKHKPKVALLNIGAEDIKGTEAVKQAAQMLNQTADINYIGYIEADEIYSGKADVVVCDGFAGNVALKASEGVAKFMIKIAKAEFKRNLYAKFIALLCLPILKGLMARFDLNQFNGGNLLGLKGIVLKSHGGASSAAFATAIRKAVTAVEMNVVEKIQQSIASKLGANNLDANSIGEVNPI